MNTRAPACAACSVRLLLGVCRVAPCGCMPEHTVPQRAGEHAQRVHGLCVHRKRADAPKAPEEGPDC